MPPPFPSFSLTLAKFFPLLGKTLAWISHQNANGGQNKVKGLSDLEPVWRCSSVSLMSFSGYNQFCRRSITSGRNENELSLVDVGDERD